MLRSENAALRARIRELVHERDAAVLGAWGQAAFCDGRGGYPATRGNRGDPYPITSAA